MKAAFFGLGLLAVATSAAAQAETDVMEESVVVGTRASLMSAIDKQVRVASWCVIKFLCLFCN